MQICAAGCSTASLPSVARRCLREGGPGFEPGGWRLGHSSLGGLTGRGRPGLLVPVQTTMPALCRLGTFSIHAHVLPFCKTPFPLHPGHSLHIPDMTWSPWPLGAAHARWLCGAGPVWPAVKRHVHRPQRLWQHVPHGSPRIPQGGRESRVSFGDCPASPSVREVKQLRGVHRGLKRQVGWVVDPKPAHLGGL
jgi:hypothetical protein